MIEATNDRPIPIHGGNTMKVILDPGHGGVLWGQHYFTKGKRSPQVGPGVGIYEGNFNRLVAQHVALHLDFHRVPWATTTMGAENMSLFRRVKFANEAYRLEPDTVLVSIHANAAPGKGWKDARGSRVFVANGHSNVSWALSFHIHDKLHEHSPFPVRDIGKANFTILKKTHCPAVLVECGFMTNREEAAFMASDEGVRTYALAITEGLLAFERGE
jgi:N-acetylmuramoyl-L-alanine amidase